MAFIGFHFERTLPSLVVEFQYKFGILLPTLESCYFVNVVSLPQPARVAERWDTAFGADARPGKYDELLHGSAFLLTGCCFPRCAARLFLGSRFHECQAFLEGKFGGYFVFGNHNVFLFCLVVLTESAVRALVIRVILKLLDRSLCCRIS